MPSKNEVAASEFVAAIVRELNPLRAKRSRTEVEMSVRQTLEGSKWLMSRYSRDAIRKNRPHITKLRNTIRRLSNDILKAPRPIKISMFSGMPQPFAELAFLNDLKEMEHRLAAANVSGSRDAIKQFSAEMACNLFVQYSDKAPTSGKPESPMRIVAALVYEYMTGKTVNDLERPCEAALRKEAIPQLVQTCAKNLEHCPNGIDRTGLHNRYPITPSKDTDMTSAVREILERFDVLPDDAVVPSKVTAIILGLSERVIRYHPGLKRQRVGDIRKLCREGMPMGAARQSAQATP